MRAWSHSRLLFPLGDKRRYPLSKYGLLRERVAGTGVEVVEPEAIAWAAVEATHDPRFVARMRRGALTLREQRVLGLPWSEALVTRTLHGIGGTVGAARDALDGGVGAMLGGGTHHAGRARARGFCLFNDVAVATALLRREGALRRVMVVDCDVHEGDGTADLLGPDPEAFALSVDGARNLRFTRIPGDLDVELPAGTGDEAYMNALSGALDAAFASFGLPDLVFYVAGADPWEGDALGRLSLTKTGLAARDALVLGRCRAAGVPVCVTLAGGYAPDVADTVDIHAATIAAAVRHGA